MFGFIQVNSLSPISDISFDTYKKYYLVFLNSAGSKLIVNKIVLKKIDNVNQKIRGYLINRTIKIISDVPYYTVCIFEHSGNNLKILFKKIININSKEIGLDSFIVLNGCSHVIQDFNHGLSFVQEPFYVNENNNDNNKCIMYIQKVYKPITKVIVPETMIIDPTFIYDREHRLLIQEKPYDRKETITRALKYHPYINNTVVCPCDGRVMAINNGIIVRRLKQDLNKIFMPYSGYLSAMKIESEKIFLKFVSSYFMPLSVKERDYLSVVNGNHTYPKVGVGGISGGYTDLLNVQPDNQLIFYIVIENKKLTNKKFHYKNKTANIWFKQGEEISCDTSYVVCLFNYDISFASDIKYYSKYDTPCKIKAKDYIGILV